MNEQVLRVDVSSGAGASAGPAPLPHLSRALGPQGFFVIELWLLSTPCLSVLG